MKLFKLLLILIVCGVSCENMENNFAVKDMAENISVNEKSPRAYEWQTTGYNGKIQTSLADSDKMKDNGEYSKYLIKNASLEIEVSNLDSSFYEINRVISRNNGYISGLEQVNNSYQQHSNITIKIPNNYLTSTLSSIERLGIATIRKEIHTTDVGEEYVDIESRLETKQEVQKRYIDVLRTKAKKVEDILATERQLGQIQEDIEAMKGRLKFLDNRIGMSSINLVVTQEIKAKKAISYSSLFFTKAGNGFFNGWKAVLNSILGVISIWPFLLIVMILFLGRRKILSLLQGNHSIVKDINP